MIATHVYMCKRETLSSSDKIILWWTYKTCDPVIIYFIYIYIYIYVYTPRVPEKAERCIKSIVIILLYSTVFFLVLLNRTTFSHHHDPKIIKFGRELLILWVNFMDCHFLHLPDFQSFEANNQLNCNYRNYIPQENLIKSKVSIQIV